MPVAPILGLFSSLRSLIFALSKTHLPNIQKIYDLLGPPLFQMASEHIRNNNMTWKHFLLMQYVKKLPVCRVPQQDKSREANNEQNAYIPLLMSERSRLKNSSYS